GEGGGRDAQALEQCLLGKAILRRRERFGRREHGHAGRQRPRRRDGNVLELVGDDVDPSRQLGERSVVVGRRDDVPAEAIERRRGGIEEHEAVTQRVAGERQHATQLAAAEHPDVHLLFLGSGSASTAAVWSARNVRSASRISGCFAPRMAAASRAAFTAPALPTASVPTGTPPGICTMASSESTPFRTAGSTGTPRTGRTVFAAVMPGRWAAPPAPAMSTSSPRDSAVLAYSNRRSGVRCAETTRTSCGTASFSRVSAA